MSHEEKLRAGARAATGDDTILDVAEFQPKGVMAAGMAGAAAGSLVGGDSNWGSGIGAGLGGVGAGALKAASTDLPRLICVAVSPDKVYLLGLPFSALRTRWDELYPIAKIDRHRLGVEVHQRASVRIVVLEDLDTGATYEMEAPRVNLYHSKALIELLMLSEAHHDEDDEETPAEA